MASWNATAALDKSENTFDDALYQLSEKAAKAGIGVASLIEAGETAAAVYRAKDAWSHAEAFLARFDAAYPDAPAGFATAVFVE